MVSSNPKLGTAFGGIAAYLHKFDAESQVSLFGVTYQYTTTDSSIAGAFVRTSFGADHHRIIAIAGFGYVKNDYDDYLGTGQPLKTNDDVQAFAARYLYRVGGDWFIGAQGSAANYQVLGESAQDDLVLETLGIRGFESAALGAVAMYDSRDSPDMPTKGWYVNINNLAYSESLGGASSFDAYRVDGRAFVRHGDRHVLAFRQYNWLTHDAPVAAQASVQLRGYKFGQYLGQNMSSLEVEERLRLAPRWTATVFAGIAALYGGGLQGSDPENLYPNGGLGLQFVLKPEEKSLAALEYAKGEGDNEGIYLRLGYAF